MLPELTQTKTGLLRLDDNGRPCFGRRHRLKTVWTIVGLDFVRDAEAASDVEAVAAEVDLAQGLGHAAAALVADHVLQRVVERARDLHLRKTRHRRVARSHLPRIFVNRTRTFQNRNFKMSPFVILCQKIFQNTPCIMLVEQVETRETFTKIQLCR